MEPRKWYIHLITSGNKLLCWRSLKCKGNFNIQQGCNVRPTQHCLFCSSAMVRWVCFYCSGPLVFAVLTLALFMVMQV